MLRFRIKFHFSTSFTDKKHISKLVLLLFFFKCHKIWLRQVLAIIYYERQCVMKFILIKKRLSYVVVEIRVCIRTIFSYVNLFDKKSTSAADRVIAKQI